MSKRSLSSLGGRKQASPERKACAITFLKAAVAYYASLVVTVERVMTDNGSCYRSRRFRNACRPLGLKHIFTRPYTPRTNGKAERFIQTACVSGPMPRLTTPHCNAPPSCLTGYTDTTGIGLMAVSAPSHPSALSVYQGITC